MLERRCIDPTPALCCSEARPPKPLVPGLGLWLILVPTLQGPNNPASSGRPSYSRKSAPNLRESGHTWMAGGSSGLLFCEGWSTIEHHTCPPTNTEFHLCPYTYACYPHLLSRNLCCRANLPCLGIFEAKENGQIPAFPLPGSKSSKLRRAHRPALQSVVAVGQVPARELRDLNGRFLLWASSDKARQP